MALPALAQDNDALTTTDDIRAEISEAMEAVADYSQQERDQALASARDALNRLDAEIERREQALRENWADMSESARETATGLTLDLRDTRNRLAERYGALEAGTSDALSQLKDGFSDAWSDVISKSLWVVIGAAAITAIMTGVGALPFLFVKSLGKRTIGWSNAAAAGLMLAASHSLIAEGVSLNTVMTLVGVLIGLGAIVAADRLLSNAGDIDVADLQGANATKALLILGIMTAHSFAEGVGVGVSFAGAEGLGVFITTAIAFHNVPEGLAIALVLVPRGTPVWKAAAWAVFTSLPQPIMAAPAFLFVETFRPFLPVGLGLAAGAMIWMVFAELFPDALDSVKSGSAATAVTLALTAMLAFQMLVLAH